MTLSINMTLTILRSLNGSRAVLGAVLGLALLCATPITAQTADDIILTVTGGPDADGKPISATYNLTALQALPKTQFETTTMWTEGVVQFEGVALKTFLDTLNVKEGTLIATALNDFRVEIPISEIDADAPMIAYYMNGETMSVRDKGPLWVVYPYDSKSDYQTEVVFSRSIWQLNRLEIAP